MGLSLSRHTRHAAGTAAPHATLRVEGSTVKRSAALLLVALLVGACGGRPSLQPEAATQGTAVVQDLPGLRVSVSAEAWQGRPRSLPEHVLPFLVTVRNTGERPVALARSDFFLLDDLSRQYLPLPPGEVVALLGGSGSGVAVSPSIGVEGSTGGGGTSFAAGLGIALGGGSGRDTRDIIPRALPEGTLQPGTDRSGFLYFPLPRGDYRRLRLVVAPQDLPGTPRVEFDFRPVR